MNRRRAIGLGCMRLSTGAHDRDQARATIHAALDAGATWLDTADAYAPTPDAMGHNERLVADGLASWPGNRAAIRVATKGGMTRPDGGWVPDGRARSLRAACERSLVALGVSRLDMYLLHAPDPRTPLRTSVRALAKLARDGLVAHVGLCNVTVAQLREAMDLVDVAAVQIELSVLHPDGLRGGVPALCIAHGIDVLAHRPLGGPTRASKLAHDPALRSVAARYDVTAQAVALAWLCDLHPSIVPLVGATRPEHAAEIARALALQLDDAARALLDARFPAADVLRRPIAQRRPPRDATGDVVVVMGAPASGKSTHARELERDGYVRLNRDELGGRLRGLVPRLDAALAEGARRVVLDATWSSRAIRNAVIETAWRHGAPVRCVSFDRPIPRLAAQAVGRILDRYGALPEPDELVTHARTDPHAFGPDVLQRYRNTIEPPTEDEGFTAIETPPASPFVAAGPNAAVFVNADLLRTPSHLTEVRSAIASSGATLVIAIEWAPDREPVPATQWAEIGRALEARVVAYACRHPGGPPRCWCRPPWPGLVVFACREHGIDPARSRLLGHGASDAALAAAIDMPYHALTKPRDA